MTCSCGAAVTVSSVAPGALGWFARCVAGHRLLLTDLHEPGVILDDVGTERL